MENLINVLEQRLNFSNHKYPKHKYLVTCQPTNDLLNRYLVVNTSDDMDSYFMKVKIVQQWKKKYPDDNPQTDGIEVIVDLDSEEYEYEQKSKLLNKLLNFVKKGKTSIMTIMQMTSFGWPYPDRDLEKFTQEALKRGPNPNQ